MSFIQSLQHSAVTFGVMPVLSCVLVIRLTQHIVSLYTKCSIWVDSRVFFHFLDIKLVRFPYFVHPFSVSKPMKDVRTSKTVKPVVTHFKAFVIFACMALVLDKCFLFSLLAMFFRHLLYLSIRMESCDLWLRWIREPLLDTMRYWLVYPHEKVTLFFVACRKHSILAPRLFTFSQC